MTGGCYKAQIRLALPPCRWAAGVPLRSHLSFGYGSAIYVHPVESDVMNTAAHVTAHNSMVPGSVEEAGPRTSPQFAPGLVRPPARTHGRPQLCVDLLHSQ